MRLVQGLVQVSWWEGLVLAHCYVELDFVLLVGRALSSGMSRGSCVLWMPLGSPSFDGLGCVLTLLVFWPEVSQQ